MGTLTEGMVLNKARVGSLGQMKHLNFWGNELNDVSIIERMPNLQVVSLSVNGIRSLSPFAHCPELVEIYIRKNLVPSLSELHYLRPLSNLRTLWLSNNPCADAPNYRLKVIRMLPQLRKLDNTDITEEERQQSMSISISELGVPPLQSQQAQAQAPEQPIQAPQQSQQERSPLVRSRHSEQEQLPQPPVTQPQSARVQSSAGRTRQSQAGTKRASWQKPSDEGGRAAVLLACSSDEDTAPVVVVAAAPAAATRQSEEVAAAPPKDSQRERPRSSRQSAGIAESQPQQQSSRSHAAAAVCYSDSEEMARPRASSQHRKISPLAVVSQVQPSSSQRKRSSPHVLRAVLALLNELDDEGLQLVRNDVNSRLSLGSNPLDK